jgi:ferredoxin-fold anticodon binding domain-containing protein
MPNEQTFFEQCLNAIGHKIEVGVTSSNRVISGILSYCTVDSLIVESVGKKEVVFWYDIAYLNLL